jgi:cephalosporin hydroxylase
MKAAKWSQNNRAGVKWRGIRVLKDPYTLSLYMSLLWELKPRSIVEIGSFEGGSALWMADMTKAMGLRTRVISYDIRPPTVASANPRLAFRKLDVMNITGELSLMSIRKLARPLLVIEDVHKNLYEVLNHLSRGLEIGDYLIVEDTCADQKHREFERFMNEHLDALFVDTNYTDNFGYNATWNWNSFLKRLQ